MHPSVRFPSRCIPWLSLALSLTLVTACSEPTAPPVAAKLAFLTQPPATTAGAIFNVVVEVQDAGGHRVTGATTSITLGLGTNPGNGTLAGTTTVAAVAGVATFANLRIERAAAGYSLAASAAGLTGASSLAFAINADAPERLAFRALPAQVVSSVPIAPAVAVEVQDHYGNLVVSATHVVTLTLSSNPGNSTLSGTTTAAAVNGVASFADLRIDKIGVGFVFQALAAGLTNAFSTSLRVVTGPGAKLSFTVYPTGAILDTPLAPAVSVSLQDAGGNPVAFTGTLVTIALGNNPAGGTLSGTTSAATVAGVASFADLRINTPGSGYTLVATATGLASAAGAGFTVRTALDLSAVGAGYFHSCGLEPGGAAWCWGQAEKLGDGGTVSSPLPVRVSGGLAFASISAGRDHTCGVTAAGVAYCWGFNDLGELGDGTTTTRLVPTAVAGGLLFAAVSAGYAHTCGITLAGAAYCWGANGNGALGDGTTQNRLVPTPIPGGLVFLGVSAGRFFSCGVTTANLGLCWGLNSEGELGNGGVGQSTTPVAVAGGQSYAAVEAGGFHACGRTTGNAVYCWGSNFNGQLGNGTVVPSNLPVPASGGLSFASLSVGNRHNCGLTAPGVAYCWGDNSDASLGDGTTTFRPVPTAVSGGLTFTAIRAGRFHTCGVATGNAAYCWGSNANGQLGAGTTSLNPLPVRVR